MKSKDYGGLNNNIGPFCNNISERKEFQLFDLKVELDSCFWVKNSPSTLSPLL